MKERELSKEQLLDEIDSLKSQLSVLKEQKQHAELETHFQKTLYDVIISSGQSIIVGLDKSHIIRVFNKGAEKKTGYSKEEVIGKDWFEIFIQPKQQKQMLQVWNHALNNPNHSYINPIITKSGEKLIVSWQNMAMHPQIKSGRFLLISIGIDITEVSNEHSKFMKSEKLLELIAQNATDWEYWKDPKGNYMFISNSCETITGYSPQDFKDNQNLLIKLVHPDFKDNVKNHFEKHLIHTFAEMHLEFAIIAKNGEKKWIEHKCAPVFDKNGNYAGRSGNNRDITQRVIADEKMKKLSAAVEQSANSIVITDIDGNIEYTNPKFTKLTEYTAEEALGQNPRILNAQTQAKEYYKNLWDTITVGQVWEGEFHNKTKSGKLFWENVTISPIKNEKGEIKNYLAVKEDITEFKKANIALKESERKYRLLADNTLDIIWTLNLNLQINYINDAVFNLSGYTSNELLDLQFGQFIPNEERERLKNFFLEIAKAALPETKTVYSIDSKHIIKNKQLIDVRITAFPLFNQDGKVNGFQGRTIDITEKIRNENIQKVLYSISNAVIITHDVPQLIETIRLAIGTIIDTSNFYVALYNQQSDTFSFPYYADRNDRFVNAPADKTLTKLVITSGKSLLVNTKQRLQLEKEGIITLQGSSAKIWLGIPLKTNAGIIGAFAMQSYTNEHAYSESDKLMLEIIADQISVAIDRKKAESTLKESEEKFRRLYDNLGDAVYVIKLGGDSDGRILQANIAATKQTGYTKNELLQLNILDDLSVPNTCDISHKLWLDKLCNHEKVIAKEMKRRKNGSQYWTEVITNSFEFNEMEACLSINRDITQNVEAEEKLIYALEKAKEADKLKSAFLANMSHEIRTPMNGILGFASLLKEEGIKREDIIMYTDVIERSGNRLLNTVNDIIDISKIEAGQMKVNISKVNYNEQLRNLFQFFQPETAKKNIELTIHQDLDDVDTTIKTDIEKFHGIFTNLIKNAIKYTNSGNIEFGYHTKITENRTYPEFFVKDTGIGIPKDLHHNIYDRFVQADLKLTSRFEGAGLGLSIVDAYIKYLHGKVWFDSEINKGTTFYFIL